MKGLFTIAKKHGSNEYEVVVGPESRLRDHRQFVRGIRTSRHHPEYSDVFTAISSRRIRLKPTGRRKLPPEKKSLITRIVDAVRPEAKEPPKAPAPEVKSKPARSRSTARSGKPSSAFAARVAAAQPATLTNTPS